MRNAGLEETQAGIKIAGRSINNLRYADYSPGDLPNPGIEPRSLALREDALPSEPFLGNLNTVLVSQL